MAVWQTDAVPLTQMNPEHLRTLLQRFQTVPPARSDNIEEFERESAIALPTQCREFLRFTDGGEGFVGPNSYAMLWHVSDLLPFNREYQVQEYAPRLIALWVKRWWRGDCFRLACQWKEPGGRTAACGHESERCFAGRRDVRRVFGVPCPQIKISKPLSAGRLEPRTRAAECNYK